MIFSTLTDLFSSELPVFLSMANMFEYSIILTTSISEIIGIWKSGGWVMYPLCILAILIYSTGFEIFLSLNNNKIKLQNNTWKNWVSNPEHAPCQTKEIIKYTQSNVSNSKELRNRFKEVEKNLLNGVERKINFLNTLVASAPLMGLLGTVIGMLSTFVGISAGAGSETVDLVASGISEALITTQTGLFIALPGIFLILVIRRQKQSIISSVLRLESQTLTVLKFS